MEIFKGPELGAIRTVEMNGELWLVGRNVALVLGDKTPGMFCPPVSMPGTSGLSKGRKTRPLKSRTVELP